jgi:hypothetical protein
MKRSTSPPLIDCLAINCRATDAVHPEYQTKPAFGWVKVGSNPAVLSTAGRGRMNIHGAVNLENFDAPFCRAHNR